MGHELTSVGLKSGLGTVSNPGIGPDMVSNPDSDPGTNSLLIHFSVTSVASSAAVQKKILAN